MSDYVIGLTGGIACGKTNLSNALRAAGAAVIDADAISRALTAPGGEALPLIRQAFGDAVFADGALSRRALGALAFSNSNALEQLNSILHPMIFERIRKEIDAQHGIVFLDVPLLYETGMDTWCNEVWCAYLPQKEQIKRLCARDGLTHREALQRIHAQMPALEKARKADIVIRTTGSPEESAALALSLFEKRKNTPFI